MKIPLIMLVGEEPVIEDTLKVKFQSRGWQVETVRGGGAAVLLIRDNAPDLLIIEAHLPDMEGYTFCQQLKDNPNTPDIPIIVLTADTDAVKTPYLYNTLARSYLRLPFSPATLTQAVENILQG